MNEKGPAQINIGLDLRPDVIRGWSAHIAKCGGASATLDMAILAKTLQGWVSGWGTNQWHFGVGNTIQLLQQVSLGHDVLLYADPPYLRYVRSARRVIYEHELLTEKEHEELLETLRGAGCMVMLSGYRSDLYMDTLHDWRLVTFDGRNRAGDVVEECLWINYPAPRRLHSYHLLGDCSRKREQIQRKQGRWVKNFGRLNQLEQQAMLRALSAPVKNSTAGNVPLRSQNNIDEERMVLSLFPGIDLLGKGFENAGYCVVRGPDKLWGGDIARFSVPAGAFAGVIGGSPCQDWSSERRAPRTGNGQAMLDEFVRVVEQAQPLWWLLENVPGVPDVKIEGYSWQRIDIRANEYGLPHTRLRHIQFGSRDDTVLVLPRPERITPTEPTPLASDNATPWRKFCTLMGLPPDFDLPGMTATARRRAVGNAVALPVANALGMAVRNRARAGTVRVCVCGCGRRVRGTNKYASENSTCRTRAHKRRKRGVTALSEKSSGAERSVAG